ncbi:MAG TPA: cyclase family protein [bacterium]|nr:cyclase family protein [bacterium]
MRLIDLSQVFRSGMMSGVADEAPEVAVRIREVRSVTRDGINGMEIILGNHAGTHIDAPRHVIPGGGTIANLNLELFFGPAVALDVRKGDDAPITVQDLDRDGTIRAGDMVFLETGWSAYAGTPRYRDHHPYVDQEAARWLVHRQVRAVGIDASSLDVPRAVRPPGFRHETLRIILGAGIPAIHGLANLAAIRGRRCAAAAFPVVFDGSDAGPARVVAILEASESFGDTA